MRSDAITGVILVSLMLAPYALKGVLEGPLLYLYWSILALAALIYAWARSEGWARGE